MIDAESGQDSGKKGEREEKKKDQNSRQSTPESEMGEENKEGWNWHIVVAERSSFRARFPLRDALGIRPRRGVPATATRRQFLSSFPPGILPWFCVLHRYAAHTLPSTLAAGANGMYNVANIRAQSRYLAPH